MAGGELYIADTNNHAVRVADLATEEVATLALREQGGSVQVKSADMLVEAERRGVGW